MGLDGGVLQHVDWQPGAQTSGQEPAQVSLTRIQMVKILIQFLD